MIIADNAPIAAGLPGCDTVICAGISGGTDVETQERVEIREPGRYKVLLHNDDVTTMDFVVGILCRIFHKSLLDAKAIMLNVHNNGIGLCGIYTRELAETKVRMVRNDAWRAGYPLKCTMEKE